MKQTVMYTIAVVIIAGLAYGGWIIKRKINYSWEYESQVKQTVKEEMKILEDRVKNLESKVIILSEVNDG